MFAKVARVTILYGRPFIFIALVLGLLACACDRKSDDINVRFAAQDLRTGQIRIDVVVLDPDSGIPGANVDPKSFRIVVDGDHIRPVVHKTADGFSLSFSDRSLDWASGIEVLAATPSREVKGAYRAPISGLRALLHVIVISAILLTTLVLLKYIYFASARWHLMGHSPRPDLHGANSSPPGAPPASQAGGGKLHLESIGGRRRPIQATIVGTVVIGSDGRNCRDPFLLIAGESLSPKHARIVVGRDSAKVWNLAGRDVKIDGVPVIVGQATLIQSSSVLKLGLVELRVTLESEGTSDGS